MLGAVALLTVIGAFLSLSTFTGASAASESSHGLSHASGHGNDDEYGNGVDEIAVSKKTSFGVVAVEHVEQLAGLTAQDLSGANHGVQNLVSAGQVQLQVSISLTNQTDDTVDYTPAQFRLRIGDKDDRVLTQSSTFGSGQLQPHANLEGRMGFVAPSDGQRLTLEFVEKSGEVITVDMGKSKVIAAVPGGHATHSETDASNENSSGSAGVSLGVGTPGGSAGLSAPADRTAAAAAAATPATTPAATEHEESNHDH